MHAGSVTQVVRALITTNFLYREGGEPLADTASLLDSGLIDSMGVLELLVLLEKTFSIRVADEEVVPDNLDSIARIAAFVRRKLGTSELETLANAG
jgi:acyl carrier protein